MSTPTGRFNLRTRKSLKLHGQIECTSCHRYYFAPEICDDENDIFDDQTKANGEKLCCDCEEKKRLEPPPKRRNVQRQNAAPATAPISKTKPMTPKIKQEKIDADYSPATNKGHCDRVSPITNGIGNDFSQHGMVQIHNVQLLTQPMLPLNVNSKYAMTAVHDFIMW